MHPLHERHLLMTRRHLLGRAASGLGAAALASLLTPQAFANAAAGAGRPTSAPNPAPAAGGGRGLANLPHFAPKAKRVIYLYMSGGPSHLESFDYKPKLADLQGSAMPESFTKGQPIPQLQAHKLQVLAPQLRLQQFGKQG